MGSIRIKLVSICAALVLIVMTISGTIMLLNVRDREIERAREQLVYRARFVNEQIVQIYAVPQWSDEFDRYMPVPAGPHDIEAVVLDATGQLIVPIGFRQLAFSDSAVISALAGEPAFAIGVRAPDPDGIPQDWLAFAMPVERDGTAYVVYTRMSMRLMNENLSQLIASVVFMVLLALVLTGLLWFMFAHTLSGPIVALTRHAKEMGEGNFDKKIPVQSRDEIGQLTETFNQMASALNEMVSTLALEKNKHEAVLYHMTDGVLAYDAEGNIMHANSTAKTLLPFPDLEILTVQEILPRLAFTTDPYDLYKRAPDRVQESTLSLNGRYITASCSPYTNKSGSVDGFVIVLQDITKHAKLDSMRREFVANVSHELRTPLTNVCSYAETLLSGVLDEDDLGTAEHFLRVIDAEAKRMSALVTDLLTLSRLDDNPTEMETEIADLIGLTKMAVTQSLISAEEKGQHIFFEALNKPCFIEASPTRINQVLLNLLSNAIKYSAAGTPINITMEECERHYRLHIQDQGMGIAPEDLPHIFERFYRVDKARSRAMGGTGLGLAIAKEIMEAHNGRITAVSEPGHGTLMTLRFNKLRE